MHTYGVWILRQTLHGVISLKTCAFAILFGAQVGESSAFALLILFKFSCAMRFTVSVLWPKIPGYSFRTSLRGNCICMPLLAFSDTDHNPLPFRSILGKKNSIQAHTKIQK